MQNSTSLLRLFVLVGQKKNFYLLNLLFFCSPKRKEAKEKGASRGRLLINGLEVEVTRSSECAGRRCPAACAARPSIRDGLNFLEFQWRMI